MPTPADKTDWFQIKQFVNSILTNLAVGPNTVRVAVVTYRGETILYSLHASDAVCLALNFLKLSRL
jgi:hypothetical protein